MLTARLTISIQANGKVPADPLMSNSSSIPTCCRLVIPGNSNYTYLISAQMISRLLGWNEWKDTDADVEYYMDHDFEDAIHVFSLFVFCYF